MSFSLLRVGIFNIRYAVLDYIWHHPITLTCGHSSCGLAELPMFLGIDSITGVNDVSHQLALRFELCRAC